MSEEVKNKKRVTLYLSQDAHKQLKFYSVSQESSISSIVDDLIIGFLGDNEYGVTRSTEPTPFQAKLSKVVHDSKAFKPIPVKTCPHGISMAGDCRPCGRIQNI